MPGDVYICSLLGAQHFVQHKAADRDGVPITGMGTAKVVVLLRSCVFRSSRGSIRANPLPLAAAAAAVTSKWLADHTLVLPTMADCLAQWP